MTMAESAKSPPCELLKFSQSDQVVGERHSGQAVTMDFITAVIFLRQAGI